VRAVRLSPEGMWGISRRLRTIHPWLVGLHA